MFTGSKVGSVRSGSRTTPLRANSVVLFEVTPENVIELRNFPEWSTEPRLVMFNVNTPMAPLNDELVPFAVSLGLGEMTDAPFAQLGNELLSSSTAAELPSWKFRVMVPEVPFPVREPRMESSLSRLGVVRWICPEATIAFDVPPVKG